MGHADNRPGNVTTTELDLNNGGWVLIGILIAVIIALVIISFYFACKTPKNESKTNLTEEEKLLINKYRELKDEDKKNINEIINKPKE